MMDVLLLALLLLAEPVDPPPPVLTRPPLVVPAARYARLPDGRYEVVGVGAQAFYFDLPDMKTHRDGKIDAWRYTAWIPARRVGEAKMVGQVLTHEIFDCEKRTVEEVKALGYDDAGVVLIWSDPEPASTPETGTPQAQFLDYNCSTGSLKASGKFLIGWPEALAFARKAIAAR